VRIAVTGGSGQLGTLVLRRLIADRGVSSIVALDLRPPLVAGGKLDARVVDVRDADVGRHLAGCDCLIHLAFIVAQRAERGVFDAVNVEGSANVLRAACEAGASQLVFASSLAAYGVLPGHPVPLIEESERRYQPDFPYAAAKHRVEELLDRLEAAHPELRVVRVRPGMMLGARMDNPMGRMLRRGWLPGGRAPLPLVWDEDVADALIAAVRRGARGAFNLVADEPLPAAELARATGLRHLPMRPRLGAALGRLSGPLARLGIGRGLDPAWLVHVDAPLVASSARARAEVGWTPRCNTALAVLERYLATAPRRLDRRALAFMRLAGLSGRYGPARPELRGIELPIHLCLTGRGGGDFGILVRGGRFRVTRQPPRPPAAILTLDAALFLDLLAGRSDWSLAQITGRCRSEGQAHAPLIVAALIATYRANLARPGVPGWLARRMGRWIEAGVAR
jgi:UDP-glucose 4-epimerase